jgi:hypothetical protein
LPPHVTLSYALQADVVSEHVACSFRVEHAPLEPDMLPEQLDTGMALHAACGEVAALSGQFAWVV